MKNKYLRLAISLSFLVFLVWYSGIANIWEHLKKIDLLISIICIAILLIAQAISAIRWQWILAAEDFRIPLFTLFQSYMIGMFMNNLLPTSIGGDISKSYDIYRLTGDKAVSLTSVFFERFTGLVALLSLSWIGITFSLQASPPIIYWTWFAINAGCILLLAAIFHGVWAERLLSQLSEGRFQKAGRFLSLCYTKLTVYRKRKRLLAKLIVVSFPIQFGTIFIYQIIAVSVGIHLPFHFFLFSVPLITLVALLPVTVGGLGVREGMTVLMFAVVGIAQDVAVTMSLLYLVISYVASLVGGLFFAIRFKSKLTKMSKAVV